MSMYEVTLPELARVLQQRSEFLKTRLSRVTKTSQLHHDEAILCWDSSGTKTLQARPPHALPFLQASPHLRCALILRMDTTHRRTGTPIGIELCATLLVGKVVVATLPCLGETMVCVRPHPTTMCTHIVTTVCTHTSLCTCTATTSPPYSWSCDHSSTTATYSHCHCSCYCHRHHVHTPSPACAPTILCPRTLPYARTLPCMRTPTQSAMFLSGHLAGHCVLCLHVQLQAQLDTHYMETHSGESRQDTPNAYLYPGFHKNGDVDWQTPLSGHLFTNCIRQVIHLSNEARLPSQHKDPTLYTTHSAKVGGALEFALRGGTLHEGQQFTGHLSALCFAMYAMLIGKFEATHTILEMQQPSLRDAHHVTSSRQLQSLLLDARTVIKDQAHQIQSMSDIIVAHEKLQTQSEARERAAQDREQRMRTYIETLEGRRLQEQQAHEQLIAASQHASSFLSAFKTVDAFKNGPPPAHHLPHMPSHMPAPAGVMPGVHPMRAHHGEHWVHRGSSMPPGAPMHPHSTREFDPHHLFHQHPHDDHSKASSAVPSSGIGVTFTGSSVTSIPTDSIEPHPKRPCPFPSSPHSLSVPSMPGQDASGDTLHGAQINVPGPMAKCFQTTNGKVLDVNNCSDPDCTFRATASDSNGRSKQLSRHINGTKGDSAQTKLRYKSHINKHGWEYTRGLPHLVRLTYHLPPTMNIAYDAKCMDFCLQAFRTGILLQSGASLHVPASGTARTMVACVHGSVRAW